MIKILVVLSDGVNRGGAETFMMKLMRAIDRSRFSMDFCVARENGYYEDEIADLGGRVIYCPPKSVNLIKHMSSLKRIIKSGNYDAVLRIGSNSLSALDLWAAWACGVKKRAFRSSNAGDALPGTMIKLTAALRPLMFLPVNCKIAPSKKAAVYTFGKRAFQGGKVHMLHNGLKYEDYAFDEQGREALRSEMGVSASDMVIGHIGRFAEQKNHVFLMRVFAELCRRHDNLILCLAGEGELMPDIRKLASELGVSDRVRFLGSRQDIKNVLSAMDLFLLPSLYEGMPNTVIEAQANGLQCLISDTVTPECNITGNVEQVPLNNPDKWVLAAERRLAEHPVHMDTGKQFYENGYDIKAVAEEFQRLMEAD